MSKSIAEQLRNNAISIISLVIAIVALTFNTWRANTSEDNRNLRYATFEMIMQLGELQLITDQLHYNAEAGKADTISGWGHIALIEDLAAVLPPEFEQQAEALKQTWAENVNSLGKAERSVESITAEIQELRGVTREFLKKID